LTSNTTHEPPGFRNTQSFVEKISRILFLWNLPQLRLHLLYHRDLAFGLPRRSPEEFVGASKPTQRTKEYKPDYLIGTRANAVR